MLLKHHTKIDLSICPVWPKPDHLHKRYKNLTEGHIQGVGIQSISDSQASRRKELLLFITTSRKIIRLKAQVVLFLYGSQNPVLLESHQGWVHRGFWPPVVILSVAKPLFCEKSKDECLSFNFHPSWVH